MDHKDNKENKTDNLTEQERCGKCWDYLDDTDEFCRKCGTKKGEGVHNPSQNIPQPVYGPPPVSRPDENNDW